MGAWHTWEETFTQRLNLFTMTHDSHGESGGGWVRERHLRVVAARCERRARVSGGLPGYSGPQAAHSHRPRSCRGGVELGRGSNWEGGGGGGSNRDGYGHAIRSCEDENASTKWGVTCCEQSPCAGRMGRVPCWDQSSPAKAMGCGVRANTERETDRVIGV